MQEPKIGVWDFVAIGAYFAAVMGAGIFVSNSSNNFVSLCMNCLRAIIFFAFLIIAEYLFPT